MTRPPRNQALLTVCIPSYAGAEYLRVVLEALLPQAARAGNKVEVVVVDDCSPDDTAAVVRSASAHGPVRYVTNDRNVGMSNNIVACTTQHARGEYVWVLSQHNVLAPGALADVVEALQRNPQIDALYVNFRAAKYPQQWPASALGGYSGEFDYIANSLLSSRKLNTWEEILAARTSVATQTYAHVVRRSLLVRFWSMRRIGREFTCALDTYSQTVAVASVMFGRPAYYLGRPVMTIFDGAQTWGSLEHRAKVYLQAHPDLLTNYARLGWKGESFREAQEWATRRARLVIVELLRSEGPNCAPLIARYLLKYGHLSGALRAVCMGLVEGSAPGALRLLRRSADNTDAAYRYLAHNWRPARWIRARIR